MKFDDDDDQLVFDCSGRRFYAYGGVVGLCADSSSDNVDGGFDGTVWRDADKSYMDQEDQDAELSPAERRELADHMIARWTEWKAKHGQ